ncbi:MBL fold metallo-hydrolase [Paenibacillus sp. 1011MAR3C5]|uniref:MBL fold metallo-hydrolase n=1 Tax=Paenibacillus sp. 1011MAR3C5 TaxID=1675787 RepID=UPI000E6BF26A|nr:MBL fold metallo-hydrolase [Paenibacillus sp. 1011MAR3C5]RJE84365.1 MBL fold metallo-hydrolase [Paenibacillus sp. 1011MAR3C5]
MTMTTTVKAMESGELARNLIDRKPLFILDVRNEDAYGDWKIEGQSIESINIPYFDLLDGVEKAVKQLPAGRPILVVCAKEGSSVFVAEQLAEAGVPDVHYLQGGMKAWSEHLEPVKAGELPDGALYQFVRLGKGCLSYMVVSGGEAAVIDAMRTTEVYEEFARNLGVTIKHALDTHLHADHISGGRKLAERTGAKYWLPPKDAGEVTFAYEKLEEGERVSIGATEIGIGALYSPGHTIGSTSFVVDGKYLLTGDILFIASIGRPDLAGQAEDWAGDLRRTLYEGYRSLSPDMIVLPAHFGQMDELGETGQVAARLGDLFRDNPGLHLEDESEFRRAVTENLPQQPNAYQQIRQTNMGRMSPTDEEQQEMEIGPNRCAIHDK